MNFFLDFQYFNQPKNQIEATRGLENLVTSFFLFWYQTLNILWNPVLLIGKINPSVQVSASPIKCAQKWVLARRGVWKEQSKTTISHQHHAASM